MKSTLAVLYAMAWVTSCAPPGGGATALSTQTGAQATARNAAFLYVSDTASDDVYVYAYPQGRLLQTLGGFDNPQGLCSDAAGDVFVANPAGYDVLEYKHGGKAPFATFYDPPNEPEGCAVDPTTSDLAVSEGRGVAIYARAAGKPRFYKSQDINAAAFCGYDDRGDLFVDGGSYYYYSFELDEMVKGAKTLKNVAVTQYIGQPGGVQWDGNYLAVGDVSTGTIYRFAVTKGQGTLEGTAQLGDSNKVDQFWIDGAKIIGPNNGGIDVMIWKYPAGGNPVRRIGNPRPGRHRPFGATISAAQ